MALTPEDVSNKRFTTVRLREGYDMAEVDQFLDEVESELARLDRESTELRAQLQAALNGEPAPQATAQPAAEPAPEETVALERDGSADTSTPTSTPAPAAAPVETIQVTTTAEASVAAARLLELAGSNADQLVAEARAQADQIMGDSRGRAEAMEAEARSRAAALEAETEQRRTALFGGIEQEKSRLDQEIETLRAFEREYRAELKTYFEDQLAALEGQGSGGVLGSRGEHRTPSEPAPGEPSRLQAVLDDES